MNAIYGDSANDVWKKGRALLLGPEGVLSPGRNGETREVLRVISEIRNPRDRWVISRDPPINPAFAIAEVVWIMNGREDSHFLNVWNSQLPKFAGSGPKYDGAYGNRLRKHFGLDQVRRVCDALASDATSRQAVLQIWDPEVDLPDATGKPASPDVPCNIAALLKVRNSRLEWTQLMRSNDLNRGLPYNLVQFTYLQEIIAGCLGISVGAYCHVADSLHVYQSDLETFRSDNVEDPTPNTDTLAASLELTDRYFAGSAKLIEKLGSTTADYYSVAADAQVPSAYRNLLLIMAAEGARRRKKGDQVDLCLDACTNPSLVQVYERWLSSRRVITQVSLVSRQS